jgi:hypothetical protein
LNQRELINGEERSVLSALVGLLNSAVHGAIVDPDAASSALETGTRILSTLERRTTGSRIDYDGIVPTS